MYTLHAHDSTFINDHARIAQDFTKTLVATQRPSLIQLQDKFMVSTKRTSENAAKFQPSFIHL